MRRYWVLALAVLTLLAGLAPPAFAQAPTPKVTISGLFDLVAAWASNKDDVDSTRRETKLYTRERGRLDFIGELGKAKAVWGIELDFTNGQGTHPGTSAGFDLDTDVAGQTETKWLYVEFPFTGKGSLLSIIDVPTIMRFGGQPFRGHDFKAGGLLANGDFGGVNLETTLAPNVKNTLTFVQIEELVFNGEAAGPTVIAGIRANQQNKGLVLPLAQLFPDVVGAANQRSACAQIGGIANAADATCTIRATTGNRESWAIIESLEFSPTKEMTVKPTFSFARFEGSNQGTVNIGTPARGGLGAVNVAQSNLRQAMGILSQWRATIGGDLRWQSGPWSLQPTFHYQWGEHSVPTHGPLAPTVGGGRDGTVDISAWIVDVIGGWRSGPLNLEARFVYTSGNKADECVQQVGTACPGGSDINYFEPINTGFTYFFGWSEIFTSGTDYATTFFSGVPGLRRGQSIGYDKYGLIAPAVRATYAVTPALSVVGLVSPSWTAEKVDTNGCASVAATSCGLVGALGATGIIPAARTGETRSRGDERYLGTEINGGITYRFAPGLVFDARYAHLFAGDAHNQCQVAGGCAVNAQIREAKDIDVLSFRVRFTF